MNKSKPNLSRRDMMKTTGAVAATTALAGVAVPFVHAAGDDAIKIALVGCGGRGGGAAANALATEKGPTRLVAMADVFPQQLQNRLNTLQGARPRQVEGQSGQASGGLRQRDREPALDGHPST